jgi:LPXTG-motif cell wall-anchored protein
MRPSSTRSLLEMLDWIQNNFFLYVGILVLILVALIAVLFVVRKNQES